MVRALKRLLRVLLVALALAVALFSVVGYFTQRRLLFPGVELSQPSAALPEGVERVSIEHEAGRTHGLLKVAATAAPAPLVVYAHGNYELAEDFPWWAEPYTREGWHVLVLEYRGYGSSDGAPSQAAIVRDALALIDAAAERDDVDGERLLFHGRSLGGGVLAAVARERAPVALLLESTFRSVSAMAPPLVPALLIRDPFDTAATLRDHYRGPVLFVHGRRDQVIPVAESEALQRVAGSRGELHVHLERGHQDSWLAADPALLVEFFGRALVAHAVTRQTGASGRTR